MIAEPFVLLAKLCHSRGMSLLSKNDSLHFGKDCTKVSALSSKIAAKLIELHNISARCVKKSDALRHGEYLSRILWQTFHALLPMSLHNIGKLYYLVDIVAAVEGFAYPIAVGLIKKHPRAGKRKVFRQKRKLPGNAVVHRSVVGIHDVCGIVEVAFLKFKPSLGNPFRHSLAVISCGKIKKERLFILHIVAEGKLARGAAHDRRIISEIPALHNARGSKGSCRAVFAENKTGSGDVRYRCDLVRGHHLHFCVKLLAVSARHIRCYIVKVRGTGIREPIVVCYTRLAKLCVIASVLEILHDRNIRGKLLYVLINIVIVPISVAVGPAYELCACSRATDTLLKHIASQGKVFASGIISASWAGAIISARGAVCGALACGYVNKARKVGN